MLSPSQIHLISLLPLFFYLFSKKQFLLCFSNTSMNFFDSLQPLLKLVCIFQISCDIFPSFFVRPSCGASAKIDFFSPLFKALFETFLKFFLSSFSPLFYLSFFASLSKRLQKYKLFFEVQTFCKIFKNFFLTLKNISKYVVSGGLQI